jgi:hypothetical protein
MNVPTQMLENLQGAYNEKRTTGVPGFDNLLKKVKEEGWNPDPISVTINHRGQPYIYEGNTRVAVAKALGIPNVPAKISWLNGAENVLGDWHMENFAKNMLSNPDITKARGGDVKLHHAGGGRTLNSNADSDVDTSYLGNLLRGLQSIPETAYDYLKNTSYSQMGSDALDLGKNVYHDITEHPIENLLGALPIVGSGMAAHDAYKLNDRIKQAYASGNHEDAKKLERALVLSSLGAIPIFGELSSVGSSAARMAEEAMLHGAAETGSRAIANSIPRDAYQVAENMASHKINQALDAAKKRMFSDMGDDHKVRSDVGRATGGRAGYATLGGVPEDDIAQAKAIARQPDLVWDTDGSVPAREAPLPNQSVNSYSPLTEAAPLTFREKLPKVLYSHFVEPMVQAVIAPGRVYRGEVQPDQMIPEAVNLASQVMLGSAPFGAAQVLREGYDPSVMRSFLGATSKDAAAEATALHTGLDRPSMGGAGMPTRILAGNPSNIQEEITVIRPTVDNPQRIAYPGVYERPDIMAAKAAARVAPEDPALKQLFGVTRDDLYQMSKDRKGTAVPDIMLGKGKTPDTVDAIMNQRNAQRLVDALGEAERYPALTKGMDAWYTMDPLYHAMVKELGPELAAKRYTQMNTRMGMMSPGSDVVSEIQRGLGADYMTEQGRFPEFSKMGGIGKYVRPSSFPSELLSMPGHPYHSTSHMGPMAKFNETGELDMGSPKVPLYIQSSNAPELGQQTRWPVPDAHFARGVGMGETRTAKDFKPSMNMAEYRPFGEWYYQNVAQPLGLEGVPAQARQWGLMGHATGVETDIGAPKLEMLAQHIMESARRNGVDPITARNEIIRGNMYNHGGRTFGNNAIDNAIRMARGGEASDGVNEPSILDTATPIEVPHSLQELQNWKKTHPRPLNKHAMDDIFSLRLSGVEGGEPIAMPASLDELLADLRRRHHASGGRLHYEDGGEADGGDPRGNEAGMADRSQSDSGYGGDSNYGGDPRGNERGFADVSQPDNTPSDVDRFSFGRDFDVSGGNYTGHEMPTGLVGYSEQRMNTPYEGSLLSATMDPSNAFGMGYGSLVGKQNTRAGAAGLLGSAMGESGQELDPSAINAGSIGMFQHTGSRARDLRDVLGIGQGVRGNELRDALAGSQMPQLRFALNEIATNPAYADTRNAMRTGTNAADVADVALENFERPSLENQIKSAPSREAYARGIMAGRPSGATLGVGQYDGTPSSIRDALRSGADLAKTQRGRFGAPDIYAANNAGNVGANALVGSYDNSTLSGDTADDTLENAMPRTPVESFEDPALIAAYNAQYGLSGPKNAYADMTLGQRTPDVTTNNPFINAVQGFGGFLADRFTPSYGLNLPEYNKISQAVYPNRDQSSDYRGDHGVQQQAINQAMALAAPQKVAAPYTTELGTYNQQLPTVDGMTAEQWAAAHTGGDMSKVHGRIKYVNGAPRLEYYTI